MPSLSSLSRLVGVLCALVCLVALSGCGKKPAPQPVYTANPAPLPADFASALDAFRPEGTKGWSFVQETVTRDHRLVEKHDATQAEFKSWTLVEKDGRAPTEQELKEYTELVSRRPHSDQAPNVRDQILRDSWTKVVGAPAGMDRYQFRLKPGAEDDLSAAFMAVQFTFDPRTSTIATVELFSLSPFKPTFGVGIEEARTVVSYHLPSADRPVLLKDILVKVRGTAFWFKKLDQDMTVTYRDYSLAPAAK